jgi:aryl-alcohol dehydrogenase-like predicted oxidoreductase
VSIPAEWPDASELRIGLGCMRLSTDGSRDEALAAATIAAAVEAGVTIFDTAHAYGLDVDDLGRNERLLVRALRECGAEGSPRIVTKGGMTRVDGGWAPDGRARAILADCEASLAALDGVPIDLYLIHAPDPRTPWRTSVRALARLLDDGLVRSVGLSNVNRVRLDEAAELVPIAAVEIALNPFDDRALRGGVVERCAEKGIAFIAHSPLGGPSRVRRLVRNQALTDIADARGVGPAEIALAWLLQLSPNVVAIPGARRPETARSAAHAATLELDADERSILARELGTLRPARVQTPRSSGSDEVILLMGIPGAGKGRLAEEYVARGYLRLNRDERGGSLRDLARELDDKLSSGVQRIVLDNTYLTRAARSHVVETAARHGVPARCIWVDTPLAQAQVNVVERLLERLGALPSPDELRALARREPGLLAPTSQMRAVRELEPPSSDEGFTFVEQVPFARTPAPGRAREGVFVAAAALTKPAWKGALAEGAREAPHLVLDWNPDGNSDALAAGLALVSAEVSGTVECALCPHPAGPPRCWCRPPLPGLPLAFARRHGVDTSRSILIGVGPAHRTLATTLGARYVGL